MAQAAPAAAAPAAAGGAEAAELEHQASPLSEISDDCPVEDDDGSATEASVATEESDYDPFAAETAEPDYDPFAAAPAAAAKAASQPPAPAQPAPPDISGGGGATSSSKPPAAEEEEDEETEGAFNALIEMMRAAEQPGASKRPAPAANLAASGLPQAASPTVAAPPRAAAATAAPAPAAAAPASAEVQPARTLDAGEESARPKRAKAAATEYEYNPKTQRWEPAKQKPDAKTPAAKGTPGNHFGGGAAAAPTAQRPPAVPAWGRDAFFAQHRAAAAAAAAAVAPEPQPQPAAPRKSFIVAECEAEARADAAQGLCEFPQALAVRLALRFEKRPADILSSMEQAGLPAAKDQRSTVKAIMRLCHPDKCKHPEAKRAMQILSPLLA